MKRFIPSLLSVALACASLESMAAADLILTNAKVFTGEPGQALQQAGQDRQLRAIVQRAGLRGTVEPGGSTP